MVTPIIASTRFNNTTWEENVAWRRQHGYEGAIYGSSKRMGETIGPEKEVIVLEMHNDENRVKGIGVVLNKVYLQERCNIYKSDRNYNRYIYRGNFRVDREELNEADEKIMAIMDIALFKGSAHSKRGRGILRLPDRIVNTKALDLPRRIEEIVLRHRVTP